MPERTLRYRTRRLHELGLLGRSRPYRERGSAPWHFWPTRRADALVRGAPAPRGGEHAKPGPVFVAHAAALTELYVVLITSPPAGVALEEFRRERDAREGFRDRAGKRRAIAPDATVSLRDSDGRLLVGFVEVDLGTMSRTRLATKARGYATYAADEAWAERHWWCPTLLFLTTSEVRAGAFCELLERELSAPSRYATGPRLVGAACAHAMEPAITVREACWRGLTGARKLTLVECLEQARRPYDVEQHHAREQQRARDAERERLRSDPGALREHLRAGLPPAYVLEQRFGEVGAWALGLRLGGDEALGSRERAVLDALAGEYPLTARIADAAPSEALRQALDALVPVYRHDQQRRVAELARRYGEGPHLRSARRQLAAGSLLSGSELQTLERDATADQRARERQAELRDAYQRRREREARRLARTAGISARLLGGSEQFLEQADRLWLRVCPDCDEVAYPAADEQPDELGRPREDRTCLFCGSRALEPWTPPGAAPESRNERRGAG